MQSLSGDPVDAVWQNVHVSCTRMILKTAVRINQYSSDMFVMFWAKYLIGNKRLWQSRICCPSCIRLDLLSVLYYSKFKFKWQVRYVSSQISNRWEPTVATAVRLKKCACICPTPKRSSSLRSGLLKLPMTGPQLFAPITWLAVAIAVWKTQLGKMILYLSCAKTAVRSTPAWNRAVQGIDETDLFRWQVMMPSKSLWLA